MLETQLAHLAWNDLTRRAPVHTEILRELTEIGIAQDLAEHLVRQLPEDTELTFARRFTIAGLSQYLKVTGDRWLDDMEGRVAFVGGHRCWQDDDRLRKIAVRWVLRHGPRDNRAGRRGFSANRRTGPTSVACSNAGRAGIPHLRNSNTCQRCSHV